MKSVELPRFRGCYNIRFGAQTRSKEAVLFLHGFPAEQGNKNVDVAEMLATEHNLDAYVIHYRGLGQSEGEFSFVQAVEDSCAYAAKLIEEYGYKRLHLVGHSFGGWVATEIFKRLGDRRGIFVMMAPFTDIEEGEGPAQLALYFMRHYPHVISSNRFDEVTEDLSKMRSKLHPHETARELSQHASDVLILNSMTDEIIPNEMNKCLAKSWGPSVYYVDLDTDHRFFRNRNLLIDQVRGFFKSKLRY